jgi:hypothetical protein
LYLANFVAFLYERQYYYTTLKDLFDGGSVAEGQSRGKRIVETSTRVWPTCIALIGDFTSPEVHSNFGSNKRKAIDRKV